MKRNEGKKGAQSSEVDEDSEAEEGNGPAPASTASAIVKKKPHGFKGFKGKFR